MEGFALKPIQPFICICSYIYTVERKTKLSVTIHESLLERFCCQLSTFFQLHFELMKS